MVNFCMDGEDSMITRPIHQAEYHPQGGGVGGGWSILFEHEERGPYVYLMTASSLWCRSVEYGIDLNDADTLFDIVLHELAGISLGVGVRMTDPDFVYHVHPTVAWHGHQRRLAQVKNQVTHPDPLGELKKITDHHLANLNNSDLKTLHAKHVELVSSIRKQRGVI